ncbi:MAG TPA: DUF1289 domain-containing protein [Pseudolabrys sp.]|nr:DUF1289 domain-containing protein [Pseudolabrys sp.]
MTAIETPCTNVCTLDPRTGLCIGCARNVDEIARWSTMSPAERARIMAELPQRQKTTATTKGAVRAETVAR